MFPDLQGGPVTQEHCSVGTRPAAPMLISQPGSWGQAASYRWREECLRGECGWSGPEKHRLDREPYSSDTEATEKKR